MDDLATRPDQARAGAERPIPGHRARKRSRRRRVTVAAAAVVLVTCGGLAVDARNHTLPKAPPATPSASPPARSSVPPSDRTRGGTYRAFSAGSWWNTPLPWHAPTDPAASQILRYMRTAPQSGPGCLLLAGAGRSPWGNPIYWAKRADPAYDVAGIRVLSRRPPEVSSLRIPVSAEPAANSDATMTVYDLAKGYVALLTDASYNPTTDQWSASGATVTYLHSNGLDVATGHSDDPRNIGTHRGNNGATMTASYDMVQAGAIRHVLKVALGPEVSDRYGFPMVGSDGHYAGADPAVPPQGLRFRIKPALNLSYLHLNPQAYVIARALQRYGFYIGDSGSATALKLENTRAEGRGQRWHLSASDLCGLPFTPRYWDVIAEGYNPGH